MGYLGKKGRDWKRFIEGYNPAQWATFTFPVGIPLHTAERKLKDFFIQQCRRTKQHIFMPYGCDTQPLRTCSTSDYHPHFHCFICYENEPIKPKLLECLWEFHSTCYVKEDGKIKKGKASVSRYIPFENGVAYTFLKHREHDFPFFCPRNKDRCNRKDRVCYFAKNPHHWKQIKNTHHRNEADTMFLP